MSESPTSAALETPQPIAKTRNAGFLLLHEIKTNKAKDARSAEQLRRFNANRKRNSWAFSRFIQTPYEHITKKLSEDAATAGEYIVEKHIFNLNYVQKIFVTLEVPSSCPVAYIISVFTSFIIAASVSLFILSTNPSMNYQPNTCDHPVCYNDAELCPNKTICEPTPHKIFDSLDEAFIIYFTIDYILRFLTLWSAPAMLAGISKKEYPDIDTFDLKHLCRKYIIYFSRPANLIDLASILPFYVSTGAEGGSSTSSFVRVLRLSRLLRVLKLGKNSATVELLAKTFVQSGPSLLVAGFVIFLFILVFASTMFIVESGDFGVTSDYPDGNYLRLNLVGNSNEVSPFNSIGTAIYYTIITMTTVGYGDIYPTSQLGRALAAVGCIVGIIVLALPLAVIANNFTLNYQMFVDCQNAKYKDAVQQSLSEARAEALRAATAVETTVLGKEQNMKNPKFWQDYTGLHQKLEAAIASEKASVIELGSKGIMLDTIDEQIEQAKMLSRAQRENLKRIKMLCQHITAKLKSTSGQASKENEDHYARIEHLKKAGVSLFTPSVYVLHTYDLFYSERLYELGLVARIFVCLEDSLSCWISGALFFINTCVILLGLVTYILSTDSRYQYSPSTCDNPVCDNDATLCPGKQICEPRQFQIFNQIDEACVIFFTIEYLARLVTLWSAPCRLAGLVSHSWDHEEVELAQIESRMPLRDPPELSVFFKYVSYIFSISNIIDVVAIVPFYISLASSSSSSSSSSFVRILRLTRSLRLLKLMKNNDNMQILHLTVKESLPVLSILAFYILLIAICFGSIIYIAEGGQFDLISMDVPGAFMRTDITGTTTERTPFTSISVGIYWAMVCCTTLGYGDMYPTGIFGRAVACVCAFFGILVLALPISVVGSTFITQSYELQKRRAEEKKMIQHESIASSQVDDKDGNSNEEKLEDGGQNDSLDRMHKSEIIFENRIKQLLGSESELEPVYMMEVAMELLKDMQVYQNELKMYLQDISSGTDDLLQSCVQLKDSHISRIQLLRQSIVDPHHVIKPTTTVVDIDEETKIKVIRSANFEV